MYIYKSSKINYLAPAFFAVFSWRRRQPVVNRWVVAAGVDRREKFQSGLQYINDAQ